MESQSAGNQVTETASARLLGAFVCEITHVLCRPAAATEADQAPTIGDIPSGIKFGNDYTLPLIPQRLNSTHVDERHILEGSVITDKISFKADIPAPIQIVKTQEDHS
jgi:hypothetical protein